MKEILTKDIEYFKSVGNDKMVETLTEHLEIYNNSRKETITNNL